MIIRRYSGLTVLDATVTSPTQRPTTYRPILAPLLDWLVVVEEERAVVIEPQSGTLGSPEPNAFMVVVPPSLTPGNIFGLELLGTDWESEGFAVGDKIDMWLGANPANSIVLRGIVRGIGGTTAMIEVDVLHAYTGTLSTQSPFPLVCFLVEDRLTPRSALLRDGDFGFNSPLNGQPFYVSGHADSILVLASGPVISPRKYNLRLYNALQEVYLDSVIPTARSLRTYSIEAIGTQFYAYRTSLDPTATVPTQAYPTRGKIVIEGTAPNELRNVSLELDCLLLHPNRLGETQNFVSPGTLTISGGSSAISAPSIPSPVRRAVCLIGPDAHHSAPSTLSSILLTSPIAPPATPPPRSGADYVGVVTGVVAGQWVAVMTNRIPSVPPTYDLEVITENLYITRYDSVVLSTPNQSARLPGVYTVIIYGLIGNSFVQLASYNLNISQPIGLPTPDMPYGTELIGNLFACEWKLPSTFSVNVANWDFVVLTGDPTKADRTLIYAPVPSSQTPPPLPFFGIPASGYLGDLLPALGSPPKLKFQVVCPDGTVLESPVVEITNPIRPDKQKAVDIRYPDRVTIDYLDGPISPKGRGKLYIRVALFTSPADHSPIDQALLFVDEDYDTNSVISSYSSNGSFISISRPALTGYRYSIVVSKTGLPPGLYTIHVRTQFDHEILGGDYESFYVDFRVTPPDEPSGAPITPNRCKVSIPAIRGEQWDYIRKVGESWEMVSGELSRCTLEGYCGCFGFVQAIPETWIDIIGHFRGSVMHASMPTGAKHTGRFMGRIIRLDDEYASEDFVSSVYRREDIVRAYSVRYQVEIFAQSPCDLRNIDILKMAEHWEIVNRSNKMLPDRLYYLKPAEVSISDSGEHAKVTITLRELKWRDEYRRQG